MKKRRTKTRRSTADVTATEIEALTTGQTWIAWCDPDNAHALACWNAHRDALLAHWRANPTTWLPWAVHCFEAHPGETDDEAAKRFGLTIREPHWTIEETA